LPWRMSSIASSIAENGVVFSGAVCVMRP
jgi:hypothetical protein